MADGAFTIWRGLLNSAIISFSATALCVYFNSMTAYGLFTYQFAGRNIVWGLIFVVMFLPGSLSFIGFYKFMNNINLTDNYLPLILPAICGATTVFFLRQYMQAALSLDLVDAARIDGAGEFGIFNKIILPQK
jgi:multiple sugar transport system permease protein